MELKFYNVKKRAMVSMPESKCVKVVYGTEASPRYAVRSVDNDGTKLTLFVTKKTYDGLKCKAAE